LGYEEGEISGVDTEPLTQQKQIKKAHYTTHLKNERMSPEFFGHPKRTLHFFLGGFE